MEGIQASEVNRRAGVKRSHSTMTESQRSGSPSAYFPTLPRRSMWDPEYDDEHLAQRPRLHLPSSQSASARFPGDGLDFRSPAIAPLPQLRQSTPREARIETVDLTADMSSPEIGRDATFRRQDTQPRQQRQRRLPRYSRDIIDITSSDDDVSFVNPETWSFSDVEVSASQSSNTSRSSPPQDDVMFVNSRPYSRAMSHISTAAGAENTLTMRTNERTNEVIDLTEMNNDDDVVLVESRQVSGSNTRQPTLAAGVGVQVPEPEPTGISGISYFSSMLRDFPNTNRLRPRVEAHYFDRRLPIVPNMAIAPSHERSPRGFVQHHVERHPPSLLPRNRIAGVATVGTPEAWTTAESIINNITNITARVLPGVMNYTQTGFDMGSGARRSPSPAYTAPSPPASGFTRSPIDDEEVVCPNCGSELAVDGETDAQRQVYVIKPCGHVYCGSCVEQRLQYGARKAGKQPANIPPILKKCVVEGCPTKITPKSFIHVYFGG